MRELQQLLDGRLLSDWAYLVLAVIGMAFLSFAIAFL